MEIGDRKYNGAAKSKETISEIRERMRLEYEQSIAKKSQSTEDTQKSQGSNKEVHTKQAQSIKSQDIDTIMQQEQLVQDADDFFSEEDYIKEELERMRQNTPVNPIVNIHENKLYIEIVLDKTYSMTTIFPAIYEVLCNLKNEIESCRRNLKGIGIYMGLTCITQSDAVKVLFAEDEIFTADLDAFMKQVLQIEFEGGAEDGKEDIVDGIRTALYALEENTKIEDNRGLLLFTDSMPMEDDDEALSFRNIPGLEKGLRFATLYVNDSFGISPSFDMVASDNQHALNQKNMVHIFDIERLISQDAEEEIENLVRGILQQSSIGGN